MDIYFTDSRGVRTEITGTITVIVETLKDYTEPIVCYVAADGAVTVMRSSADGKKITFRTNHNSYYVLAEKVPGGANSKPGTSGAANGQNPQPGTSGITNGQNPQTGDTSNLWLWGAVMLPACRGLAGCILFGRKKKQDAD